MRNTVMEAYWIFILLSLARVQGRKTISKTLLNKYIKYCGIQNDCMLDTDANLTSYNQTAGIQTRCPSCTCDTYLCAHHEECCPNVVLSRISTEGFEEWRYEHFSTFAIGVCPENANSTIKILCSRDWKHIADTEFYGVSDHLTNVRYKNKYCALCNGCEEWDTWLLNVYCISPYLPINLYSSKDELFTGLSKYGCRVHFDHSYYFFASLIEKCNVTGQWDKYDSEMEHACKYHPSNDQYSIFRNIFCYMCNTGMPPRQEPYLYSCTIHTDSFLESLCLSEPIDTRFYPYKNQYCKECNTVLPLAWITFESSGTGKIETFDTYRWKLKIALDFCEIGKFDIYKFLNISSVYNTVCDNKTKEDVESTFIKWEFESQYQRSIVNRPTRYINLTDLYEEYKKFDGVSPWCFPTGNNASITCGCDVDCFRKGNCCPDIVFLSNNSHCVDFESYPPSILARCQSPNPDNIMRYYCERNEDEYESLIDFIPVYSKKKRANYKNVFCEICSEPPEVSTAVGEIFWDVSIECKEYLDVDNYIQLAKSFKEIREICDVKLNLPQLSHIVYSLQMPVNSQCLKHDVEHSVRSNLDFMCRWGGHFIYSTCKSRNKNIFCEMFDKVQKCTNVSCNLTINCDDDDTKEEHPFYSYFYYYPYQFTFNPFNSEMNRKNLTKDGCNTNEFYDKENGKCREIKCSPGKLFMDSKCIPLLNQTTGLGYKMQMIAKVKSPTLISKFSEYNKYTIHDFLIEFEFRFHVTFADRAKYVQMKSSALFAPLPCKNFLIYNDLKHLEVIIDMKMETFSWFSLQIVDEHLYHKINNISFEIDVYSLPFETKRTDRNISNVLSMVRTGQYCSFSNDFYLYHHQKNYFEINKFLICPQIALEKEEYEIINSSTLKIHRNGKDMNLSYAYGLDGKAIICLSDYQASVSSAAGSWMYAFHLMMTISMMSARFLSK